MKINEKEYVKLSASGSRKLFEHDGYGLLDCMDAEDNQSYILINYDDDVFHSISLQDAYGLAALYITVQNGETFEGLLLEALEQVEQSN